MVDPKGLKRRFSDVLQEQEELLENSEVILDSESPSEFASRVYGDQPESQSRKRRRASIPEQTELNANIARFDHIPQDETSFNPTAASLPPNQLVPPSNLTARPVFPHRTLPLPVPTAAPRHDPFTAATNALSRPAPPPNSLGIPSPHTGLSQPPRTHPYPSNMVSATPENEGSHRTPTRTPLPTMPTTQVVPPTAQDTWLGVVLQSTDLSIHQPRARSVSMPHVLSYGSSSSPEPRAEGAVAVADEVADADVDAVADADAQPSTLQNADPTLPRAQSLSPFQNARLYRQRAQSSPLSMRGGALWTAASTPYQNGQTPVQNTPLPFQHGQFYYQNGHSQDAQPCSQNDYVQNAQNYSQNGCVQNCYAQPYYASGGKPAVAPTPVEDKSLASLSNLFEKYRGSDDEKDSISVDGTMAYLTDLAVNLEDASSLIPLEIVQAPAIGEMTRDGFVKGWQKAGVDSRSTLDTIPKQKAYIASQTKLLSSDTALFKRVYKHTFVCSKERSQKALPLENALVYWEMLFSSPGMCWASGTTDWLKLWLEFLNAKWTKTVNKDMWNQTLEFFTKSREDETMSFWSEEGAWPSVIDDFVVWVREKRGGGAVADNMETD
ncbi:hypothetical protein VE04_02153 [Pseudogymnoascus sp. 24MN13]|nr:hypothetical protein VE04_02153 [Pseudogymnoascus sp. 24MN13]